MRKVLLKIIEFIFATVLLISTVCLITGCGGNSGGNDDDDAEYTVTFVAVNKDTLEPYVFDTQRIFSGEKISTPIYKPESYEDEHYSYEFYNWRVNDGSSLENYIVKKDTVVEAKYTNTPKVFTLTFKLDGDIEYKKQLHFGEEIVYDGDMPVKNCLEDGYEYVFTGFSGLSEGKTVTGNETFTANFEKQKRTYTISYYDFQNDLSYTEVKSYNDELERKSDDDYSERNGYTFEGYLYYDKDEKLIEKVEGNPKIVVKGNISVRERWSEPILYTVDFKTSGNNCPSSFTYKITDDDIYLNQTSSRSGCEFLGWYDVNGKKVDAIYKGSYGSFSLTAKFAVNPKVTTQLEEVYEKASGNSFNLTFLVSTDGDAKATYQWYYNDQPIVGAVSSVSPQLNTSEQSGEYYCIATVKLEGIGQTEVKSKTAMVLFNDGNLKNYNVVFDYKNQAGTVEQTYKFGDALTFPENPRDYTSGGREYTFERWEFGGNEIKEGKRITGDMLIEAVYVPYHFLNYYVEDELVKTDKVKYGSLPVKPTGITLPQKTGYVPSWKIDFNQPVTEDKRVDFLLELDGDIQNFIEQSLDAVFTDRQIGFTINLGGVIDLKLYALITMTGMRVDDIHGAGKNYSIEQLLEMADIKLSIGSSNPVKVHIINKNVFVQIGSNTFKMTCNNFINLIEGFGIEGLDNIYGKVINMVDMVNKTADRVISISLDKSTNILTIDLIGADKLQLLIKSDYRNGKYSVNNISFDGLFGKTNLTLDCAVTDGLVINLDKESGALDYDSSITELATAAKNLFEGRHFALSGNISLNGDFSIKGNIPLSVKIDRYEKGDTDEYGNAVTEKFSVFHIAFSVPKIKAAGIVDLITDNSDSEIFIDTRYPDKILFKTTRNGNTSGTEYKSLGDFNGDTFALCDWLLNLSSMVEDMARNNSMTVSLDAANILKGLTYSNGLTKLTLDNNAIKFSSDMVAIVENIVLGLQITDGYPESLTLATGLKLKSGVSMNLKVNANINFDKDAMTVNQKTQSAFDTVKKEHFAALFA